ncbi:MAG: Hsp70 family protein, partial [Anaerolineales bacterium]|nr:Hsp70 family protein [Anaerolineales bacterium]
ILVFDFGGGTLDITVMRLGNGRREILATGGIPIAGDVFDSKLVRAKLPRHFGEGSSFITHHKEMPVPSWIYDIFSDWQRILELQTPENREMLAEIAAQSVRPREIEALINLVADNYALQMFDATEQAKRRLSDDMGTLIKFDGPKFNIRQLVTRTEFETIIRDEVLAIDQHLDEMVAKAGLTHKEIDIVVRTGGSAEIPIFRHMLEDKFGKETVREVDTFSSVTSGLGIIAHGIAQGEIELRGYTPNEIPPHVAETHSNVPLVNLDLLQKRIALREDDSDEDKTGRRLMVLANGNHFELRRWPLAPEKTAFALPEENQQWAAALTADYDEPLLLITSTYRFMIMTPRQLDELEELGMTISDLYHFRIQEEICAMCRWAETKDCTWLTIVTSRGYARGYRLSALKDYLESPAPYQFDNALPGVPVALLGAEDGHQFVLYNSDGRAQRFPMTNSRLRVRGVQALNWKEGERVMGAQLVAMDDELLLGTRDGYGRRVAVADLPLGEKGNERPPILSTRKPVQLLSRLQDGTLLISSQGIRPLDGEKLPPAENSSKTYKLGRWSKDEALLTAV